MRYTLFLFSLLLLTSCSDNSPKKDANVAVKKKRGVHIDRPQVPKNIDYARIDSAIRIQIKRLDSLYGRTPYYTIQQNKKMFVVLKGKFNPDSSYYLPKFTGRFKYGIAGDDLTFILPCEYDKIYNPNLTALNCMEIKVGSEVGLFNYTTKEILKPQFDYICPSSSSPDNMAYGFKDGDWYSINTEKNFRTTKADFSPLEILKSLSFNVENVTDNLFLACYNSMGDGTDNNDPSSGIGVVMTPSFIEHLNLMPEICEDLILPEQKGYEFGINQRDIKTEEEKSIGDKISSFFVSFYEHGAGGRDWVEKSGVVLVYNKENKTFNSASLKYDIGNYYNLCDVGGYKFVNDTLIELVVKMQEDTLKKKRYDLENTYSYKSIAADGTIKDLYSNRYYSFTKYFEIDESYFKGCYGSYMDEKEMSDEGNMWATDHLTLEDLSLMVNEIYAEYGFKFKTEKWSTYFSRFKWYHPQFDNVDDKLTAVDKKNIALINKEKEKMKGKEDEILNKRKVSCYAAG